MRIAIFGANSQIAKDLILSCAKGGSQNLTLFSRRPEVVLDWLREVKLEGLFQSLSYSDLALQQTFDGLINFVGVGDPAKALDMGKSIFDVTFEYDTLAINYLNEHPQCRYIFLSSGAVYGARFDSPADSELMAKIPINNLQAHDWYGVSKLHAEARHRALQFLSIVDIRIFNYFSHTQDMSARFLISDIVRSIDQKKLFITSDVNIVRDYLHPHDFFQLIIKVLTSPRINCAVDCYSKSPVDKKILLQVLQAKFNLNYKLADGQFGLNATGIKKHYYSLNHAASQFGYEPLFTALDCVTQEIEIYLKNKKQSDSPNAA